MLTNGLTHRYRTFMNNAILFLNYTNEDFSHAWNGVGYTFKAGTSMYLEPWMAEHFAKHLIDREINKMNVGVKPDKEIRLDNQMLRKELMDKCIKIVSVEAKGDAQLKAELLDLNMTKESPMAEVSTKALEPKKFCDQCDSKGVRHKKTCPKVNATVAA